MAFVRVKPSSWAFGEKLTSSQMNTLDLDHSRAVDGFAGGNYTPSAVISVLGSGFGACDVATGVNFTWKGTTNYPRCDVRSVSTQAQLVVVHNSGQWAFELTGYSWVQTATSGNRELIVPLKLPSQSVLTTVLVWLDGDGGGTGHAALPATMPRATLYRRGQEDPAGATTMAGPVTDGSGTVGAYHTPHAITLGSLSETIDGLDNYYLLLEGEAGANSAANALRLSAIQCTIDITKITVG